jgi:uncharacterized membrane protein (UPF0127 family)
MTKNTIIASRPVMGGSFSARLLGLMFRESFPACCDALLLYPCRAIHTFFMRFPIDLLQVDERWQVISTCEMVQPGRISAYAGAAAFCVELPAGTVENSLTSAGDRLQLIK